jgi:deoxyribodipyrimidine photolyase-related protein
MRHFAEELRALGYEVDYYQIHPSFRNALQKHTRKHQPKSLCLMDSAEFNVSQQRAAEAQDMGLPVVSVPSTMFLSDKETFQRESEGKRSRIMEAFYRKMRERTGILMDAGKPTGGKWNYDAENRRPPADDLQPPSIPKYTPDAITRKVMAQVQKKYPDHFGRIDSFAWPVTRCDAEVFLENFLEHRLPLFGPYQDAMVLGQRALFHSLVSPLLNLGLLDPLEVCRKTEERYTDGRAPLNSVEGFIRQILGWREYVYQVYHWRMPGYLHVNHLKAELPLPDFYWSANTAMRCVREAVEALLDDGINHHIQRLMITGNFALIAGLDPQQVNEWYWTAYVDAHEWVVTPNVLGMTLYADGGILGSKPYAASANYINRMSDYCRHCKYNPRRTTGDDACPFNALYWDFLARNESVLRANPRMALSYRNLDRRKKNDLDAIRAHARALRLRLSKSEPL